ncbi:hypothetical protein GCM10025864_11240 [Luteimicrobium album]|uniref:Uncharacterized protein n=1 Tax=Luteimicrobium album TaxID=1054550 RepID=A0ABQ6HXX8_9MICO|nr:hypothetical protein GCM10025864_11240 [Luteimicrobium album]
MRSAIIRRSADGWSAGSTRAKTLVSPATKVARATPPTERHAVFGESTMRRPARSAGTRRARPAAARPARDIANGPTTLSVAKPPTSTVVSTATTIAADAHGVFMATTIATPASRNGRARVHRSAGGVTRAATPRV